MEKGLVAGFRGENETATDDDTDLMFAEKETEWNCECEWFGCKSKMI